MATLDGTSTLAQITAEYGNTASWEESGDVGLARRFLTACRLLLLKLPKSNSSEGASVSLNPELIKSDMERARSFVDRAGGAASGDRAGGVRHADFRNFR